MLHIGITPLIICLLISWLQQYAVVVSFKTDSLVPQGMQH